MKLMKKNQLVILIMGLMLVTSGYLNFIGEQNINSIETSGDLDIASIGDATLVNSGSVEEDNSITENPNKETVNAIVDASSVAVVKEDNSENNKTVTTNNSEYFTASKLQRDTMYSQMIESYQKMLDSTSVTAEQKAIAQNEITKINTTKNAIMIAENLIKTKGFKDVIILVNDNNINVIIDSEEIKPEEIAQIQNIVSREMKAEIENIHITER